MRKFLAIIGLFLSGYVSAQTNHIHERAINFPDVGEFITIKTDFHIHTVFSDGLVWPSIRVEEAVRDNLDAISITDHLEYQPHKKDIPHKDRNRGYEIAQESVGERELLVIPGTEISRGMPPGHANALFITDANRILKGSPLKVFTEANNQQAFVVWNHPNWIAHVKDGIAKLTPMHEELIEKKLIHGIEVVNEFTYSVEALKLALDNNLTIMGTSDIHGLVDWQFNLAEGGHRPITLVFAKERTVEGIKEALFAGRTVVWFNHMLVGKKEHMVPLLKASIKAISKGFIGKSIVAQIEIKNESDAEYVLNSLSPFTFHTNDNLIILKPNSTYLLEIKTVNKLDKIDLKFEVLNAITAPDERAIIEFSVEVD